MDRSGRLIDSGRTRLVPIRCIGRFEQLARQIPQRLRRGGDVGGLSVPPNLVRRLGGQFRSNLDTPEQDWPRLEHQGALTPLIIFVVELHAPCSRHGAAALRANSVRLMLGPRLGLLLVLDSPALKMWVFRAHWPKGNAFASRAIERPIDRADETAGDALRSRLRTAFRAWPQTRLASLLGC